MAIRISKIARDYNVASTTVVEFLRKKGYGNVPDDLNYKLSDEQHQLLVSEYSKDKEVREDAKRRYQELKRNPDYAAPSAAVQPAQAPQAPQTPRQEEPEIIQTVYEEPTIKLTLKGRIDLDGAGTRIIPEEKKETTKEEKPVEKPSAPAPVPASAPAEVAAKAQEKSQDTVQKEVKENAPAPQAAPVHKAPEEKETVQTAEVKPAEKKKKDSQLAQIPSDTSAGSGRKPEQALVSNESEKAGTAPEAPKAPKAEMEEKREQPARTAGEAAQNSAPVQEKKEEIFRLNPVQADTNIKVVGKVDLAAINLQTRPKKKTKEEKKKERESKELQRQQQRQQFKENLMKEIGGGRQQSQSAAPGQSQAGEPRKKKRVRITAEKVDINKSENFQNQGSKGSGKNSGQQNQQGRGSKNSGKNGSQHAQYTSRRDQKELQSDSANRQLQDIFSRQGQGKNKSSKYRKEKREAAQNRQQEIMAQELSQSKILKLTEYVTANELATMMNISVTQVIQTCMSIGMMVSINQRLDAETINIVAEEYGFMTEYVSAEVAQAIQVEVDKDEDLQPRAPIVTVMGHVDHGKTSLLDYIRKSNVIAGEAGGITQHIGAYNVTLDDGRKITFLDTPGHEAFTAMRARGAKVTDIVIVIVAADDNVMPQTKEAIAHATAAGVPIVFAINKVDKPAADPERIKQELAQLNFLVEDWGGKYQSQDISAKKGTGVNELMEKVLLEAELLELKANPNRNATGSIIESSLDKGRGYIATVLVQNGTLKIGDVVLAGTSWGKVKAMFNERNQRIKEAAPAEPVLILGLNGAPQAGVTFNVVDSEREAREITGKREQLAREQGIRTATTLTLDELGRRIAMGDFHELNLIVKADVDGSIEALSDSLIKLSTPQVQVNVIHKAVGAISESDVSLAAASNAIIIGFDVRPSGPAKRMAEQESVDIRIYSVIYDAIDEVKAAMEGLLAPKIKEVVTSMVEIMEVFHVSKVGMVAGCRVRDGKVSRNDKARVIRDGIVIHNGDIQALKRFKDDVKEVSQGFECGMSLVGCNDLKVGDMIETYSQTEVKQTL